MNPRLESDRDRRGSEGEDGGVKGFPSRVLGEYKREGRRDQSMMENEAYALLRLRESDFVREAEKNGSWLM